MLKFTHFEGLDNLWKQLFILVPHSAVVEKGKNQVIFKKKNMSW